jgi:hypothetical protein
MSEHFIFAEIIHWLMFVAFAGLGDALELVTLLAFDATCSLFISLLAILELDTTPVSFGINVVNIFATSLIAEALVGSSEQIIMPRSLFDKTACEFLAPPVANPASFVLEEIHIESFESMVIPHVATLGGLPDGSGTHPGSRLIAMAYPAMM